MAAFRMAHRSITAHRDTREKAGLPANMWSGLSIARAGYEILRGLSTALTSGCVTQTKKNPQVYKFFCETPEERHQVVTDADRETKRTLVRQPKHLISNEPPRFYRRAFGSKLGGFLSVVQGLMEVLLCFSRRDVFDFTV